MDALILRQRGAPARKRAHSRGVRQPVSRDRRQRGTRHRHHRLPRPAHASLSPAHASLSPLRGAERHHSPAARPAERLRERNRSKQPAQVCPAAGGSASAPALALGSRSAARPLSLSLCLSASQPASQPVPTLALLARALWPSLALRALHCSSRTRIMRRCAAAGWQAPRRAARPSGASAAPERCALCLTGRPRT